MITLDQQAVLRRCPRCATDFDVVRGSVYDEAGGIGLYLVALHGHDAEGRLAHLAIALRTSDAEGTGAVAAAMDVVARLDTFTCALVDWATSPWRDEAYLGRQLSPAEIRSSHHRHTFFAVADRVLGDVSQVRKYFAEPPTD